MVMPQVFATPETHGLVHVPVPNVAHAFPDGSSVALCGWTPPGGTRPQRPSSVKCLDCMHLAGRRGFFARAG